MPSRNRRKTYLENTYYHLYNRGVEKRIIFQDQQDYSVFLSYLKDYLLPKDTEYLYAKLSSPTISAKEKDKILKLLRLNNFAGEVDLVALSLMPNHFHFLINQKSANSIDSFMNSLCTRYSMYFNRKHKRVGSLYQEVYKAAAIITDEQLLHLSRYIHQQSIKANTPSSYEEYIGKRKTAWIKPNNILDFFNQEHSKLTYQDFVGQKEQSEIISPLLLETD